MNENGRCWLMAGIGLLVGAAAGGTGMYFYSKRYFQAKMDAELQSMGEFYIKKYEGGVKEKNNEGSDKKESNEEQQTEEDIEKRTSVFEGQKIVGEEESNRTAYADCFDDSTSDKLPSSSSKTRSKKKKKKVDIEIVDQSVWDDNPGGLDSKFLVYYDADGVLIDEESEKIFEDGMDDAALVKLIDIHSDEADDGVLILQSNFTQTLYHVTVEQASYAEIGSDD